MIVVLAIVTMLALLCFTMSYVESKKPKKVKSMLSTVPQSAIDNWKWETLPVDELSQWWNDNHSKDAEIKRLNELVASKSALITKLQNSLVVKRGNEEYIRIPTPTFNDSSKVMILPDSYSSKVGVTLTGLIADAVMNKDMITKLTVHDGKVVEWSTESLNK